MIAYVIPDQARYSTLAVGLIATVVGAFALLAGALRRARMYAAGTLAVCGFAILPYLWVWSVQIVAYSWGIGWLYIINFFLPGAGAIVAAFLALLTGGHWSILWQFAMVAGVGAVFILVSAAYGESVKTA